MNAAVDEIANTYDVFGILEAGPNLLHQSTWNFRLENMRILVNQGVDINSKDVGDINCLFTLLRFSEKRISLDLLRLGAGFFETARYLIESGIDMTPNASGATPAQYAYHLALVSRSSCLGDSWDRVLATCGLNISKSRAGHPRIGRYRAEDRYNHTYTLRDFKELWDGQESLCPYYEEAIADSTVHENRTIDWSRACTDETCPYYEMRGRPDHWDSDNSSSSSSEDSSEDGGVIIDSTALDTSEDSELLQDRS